jgi:hypothetical protein
LFGNGSIRASFFNADIVIGTPGGAVSPGKWHHVVFSYDENEALLYLDGELVGTDDSVNSYNVGSTHIYMGTGDGLYIWNPRIFKSSEGVILE